MLVVVGLLCGVCYVVLVIDVSCLLLFDSSLCSYVCVFE